jgi:hypothetical protein
MKSDHLIDVCGPSLMARVAAVNQGYLQALVSTPAHDVAEIVGVIEKETQCVLQKSAARFPRAAQCGVLLVAPRAPLRRIAALQAADIAIKPKFALTDKIVTQWNLEYLRLLRDLCALRQGRFLVNHDSVNEDGEAFQKLSTVALQHIARCPVLLGELRILNARHAKMLFEKDVSQNVLAYTALAVRSRKHTQLNLLKI